MANTQAVYRPVFPARTEVCRIRDIDCHVSRWGDPNGRPVFLLHGWMDCAATFQFMIDAAPAELLACNLIAPDWRGFGQSGWAKGGYWFPDYLGDLDALMARYSPSVPAALVGHSMGGIVAGLYAGVRPERVSHLVSLEGFGLAEPRADDAPGRYRRWLDELQAEGEGRLLAGFDDVAARLRRNNPKLPQAWAHWLAPYLAIAEGEGVRYRADPRHRHVNPVLYRLEEAKACWRNVTAKVLWLGGDTTALLRWLKETPEVFATRQACFANFRYEAVEGAGHQLHHDEPALLAGRITAFLAEVG